MLHQPWTASFTVLRLRTHNEKTRVAARRTVDSKDVSTAVVAVVEGLVTPIPDKVGIRRLD